MNNNIRSAISVLLLSATSAVSYFAGKKAIPIELTQVRDSLFLVGYACMMLEDASNRNFDHQIRNSLIVIHSGIDWLSKNQPSEKSDPTTHADIEGSLSRVRKLLDKLVESEKFSAYADEPVVMNIMEHLASSKLRNQ
jgi:hypothetical protein